MLKIKRPLILDNISVINENFMTLVENARLEDDETENVCVDGIVLSKEDISSLSFNQVKFKNCEFVDCDFEKASFVNVIFEKCDFSNSNFENSYFSCCEIISSKWIGARFVNSSIKDFTVNESNFNFAILDKANLRHIRFSNTTLNNANITESALKDVELEDVELVNANFFKTSLKGIDFTKSQIGGISMSNNFAELKGAIVNPFQASELAKLLGVIIKWYKKLKQGINLAFIFLLQKLLHTLFQIVQYFSSISIGFYFFPYFFNNSVFVY